MLEEPMLEAHTLIRDNSKTPNRFIDLTFDDRQKSRHRGQTTCGQTVGWFIERGLVLKDGDLLECTNGDLIKVTAANESVSTAYAKTPLDLLRAAYHLGNRHVPLQITAVFLRFQHDHVLDDMVRGLGLNVEGENAPFQPEAGAYAAGQSHSHSQSAHSHVFVRTHTHEHK